MVSEKAELLKEFEEKFKEAKKQFGIKTNIEEINECFFIRDNILSKGFVSQDLLMQICSGIVDNYYLWNNYLHGLVIPNNQNMMQMTESKMFNEDDKKEILNIIKGSMPIIRAYGVLLLTKDKTAEAKFIDNSVAFWKKNYSVRMLKIMKKVVDEWSKK